MSVVRKQHRRDRVITTRRHPDHSTTLDVKRTPSKDLNLALRSLRKASTAPRPRTKGQTEKIDGHYYFICGAR